MGKILDFILGRRPQQSTPPSPLADMALREARDFMMANKTGLNGTPDEVQDQVGQILKSGIEPELIGAYNILLAGARTAFDEGRAENLHVLFNYSAKSRRAVLLDMGERHDTAETLKPFIAKMPARNRAKTLRADLREIEDKIPERKSSRWLPEFRRAVAQAVESVIREEGPRGLPFKYSGR